MKRLGILLTIAGLALGQAPNPTQQVKTQQTVTAQNTGPMPVYRITVVGRTAKAVNYRHRSGATKIDFEGTPLLPKANGEAKVESKQGYIEIEVEFDELQPASRFGPEYLTYVLWAITPEGRAKNLGELLLNGNRGKLNVTTELQAFGLLVTAEPYFAVTQPSDVVVLENVIRPDTAGKIEAIDAKYELLQRGQYRFDTAELQPIDMSPNIPLELYEARNAVRIADLAGADQYASDTFKKAQNLLLKAEGYQSSKAGKKPVVMTAREAVQTAEDARLIAVKRVEEERLAKERQAAQDKVEAARQQAEREAAERAAAERAKREADQNRLQAERDRLAAEQAKQAAERARQEAEAAARQAEAERARALSEQQAALAEAEKAKQRAAEAEQERARLREELRQQLNLVLETRDTARGLIVNMSDVLFDTAKYSLKPGAREKLAKVAGILITHPKLKIEVEGHTDSVGSDEYNQRLSENRANSVREYLVAQGVKPDMISSRGFGEGRPVASNDNAAGRQQNRRVELVVSGEEIGQPVTSSRR